MKLFIRILSLSCISLLPVYIHGQSPAESFFKTYCQACHTIGGGRLVGPDLKNVHERADRSWLVNWILDPQAILDSGDKYALKILSESNNIPMIKSAGINEELANGILDYIKIQAETNGESQNSVEELVLTEADLKAGKMYFTGQMRLENGGPACLSCHTVNSLTGLGGGRLGVDLTDVYNRLGGSRGLNAWLKSPPAATMLPIFSKKPLTDQENIALIAFLKSEASAQNTPIFAAIGSFIFYGTFGALVLLIIMGILWENRFRGVRRSMINQQ